MTDTRDHIKKLQLQIWLSKSPAERLYEAVKDNEDLFSFWQQAKQEIKSQEQHNMPRKP